MKFHGNDNDNGGNNHNVMVLHLYLNLLVPGLYLCLFFWDGYCICICWDRHCICICWDGECICICCDGECNCICCDRKCNCICWDGYWANGSNLEVARTQFPERVAEKVQLNLHHGQFIIGFCISIINKNCSKYVIGWHCLVKRLHTKQIPVWNSHVQYRECCFSWRRRKPRRRKSTKTERSKHPKEGNIVLLNRLELEEWDSHLWVWLLSNYKIKEKHDCGWQQQKEDKKWKGSALIYIDSWRHHWSGLAVVTAAIWILITALQI